jgi:hypothetical protein
LDTSDTLDLMMLHPNANYGIRIVCCMGGLIE